MRRRVTLYIAEQAADLSDDALVLLNIQREDLYNPAVVLNSYSQAVTLPGTANNDIIFGHYFRADHSVAGGFNPLVRVPFSIFADTGDVLVAGYCKLLNVTTQNGAHTYEVQLYGSLGEFIYGLAYDADGNKKSLASLDYLGGGDTELDFVIDKTAVAEAWARLGGDTSKPAMWDVVNFAPCYNGIPDGDFDAGKALAKPGDVGLTLPAGYNPSTNGYVLINLPEGVDEWAAHDLRSYLQRPVLSVKALMEAIARPENNGGWTLDLSDIDTAAEWPYLRTWITRPLLPSLGSFKQTTGGMSVTFDNTAVGQRVAKFDVSGNLPGEKVSLRMEFAPVLSFTGQTAAHIYMQAASAGEPNYSFGVVTFIQPVAYDSSNNIIAYGNVLTLCPNPNIAADTLAEYLHFTPQGGAALISTQQDGDYDLVSAGIYKGDKAVTLEVSAVNLASVRIMQTAYTIGWHNATNVLTSRSGDGTSAWACGWTDPSTSLSRADADGAASADGTGTATSTPNTSIRSGARISKQMLLSTDGTPADYLLAICKSFGLYILTDGATKTARIVRRSTLYQNETIDLTERVDTSRPVEIQPLAIEAKYYDWKHQDVGAAFGKEYKETSGRDYGAQRVNTGYDFDAKARDVLEGVVLKGTAAVKGSGRHWCWVELSVPGAADIDHVEPGTELPVTTLGEGISMYRPNNGIITSGYASNWWIWYYPVTAGQEILIYATDNASCGSVNSILVGFATSTPAIGVPTTQVLGGSVLQGYKMVYTAPSNGYICIGQYSAIGQTLKIYNPVTIYNYPALFLDAGNTFTSWDTDGQSTETQIPSVPSAATITQYAGGYDKDERAQFHAKDGKPVDGADVLLFAENYFGLTEFSSFEDFQLTDDVPDMDTTNGKPCWMLGGASGPLAVPHFSRYVMRTIFPDPLLPGETSVWRALDFGIPAELDIPNITYDRGTIYEQAWKRYVADRLDKDTKVLRCRVRLDGLQVGQGLLRKFYWYRGSLWSLNKITNYSLTTYDPAECEFIQVQDIDNYV
jgi:hypothetical protein